MTHPFAPTYGPVPPGPLAGPLQMLPVNAEVVAVHTATGAHVGSLKKLGGTGPKVGVNGDVMDGLCCCGSSLDEIGL